MKIKLSPVVFSAQSMTLFKQGDSLTINGLTYDFEPLGDGATLPVEACKCPWLIAPIERTGSELIVTLLLPIPEDASYAARFPSDIVAPQDGRVSLPIPDAVNPSPYQGYAAIDWSQEVTVEDKAVAASALLSAAVLADVAQRRIVADAAIAPLQDAVDLDDATPTEVEALKTWKRYRVALSRVPEQAGYPSSIDWPALPA